MMDTDWILWTFKKEIGLLLLIFLASCSPPKRSPRLTEIGASGESLKVLKVKEKKIRSVIPGPSKGPSLPVFIESSEKYGLKGVKATHLYAVDFNNDGHTDLVVLPTHYSAPEFYRFDEKSKRFIKNKVSPFGQRVRASYLTFIDIDKDKVLDLLVGTLNQKTELTKRPLRLFKGRILQGRVVYNEVVGAFPKNSLPTATVAFLDYDLDGYLDLFQGNWFDFKKERPEPLPDRVFQGGGLSFKEVKGLLRGEDRFNRRVGIYPNARPTFGSAVCDIDQNGFPDILTAASSGHKNKLWLNLRHRESGGRIFKDHGEESGYAGDADGTFETLSAGNTFFSNCADYNNDAIMDIAVGELYHSYDHESKDRSSVLTGSRPGYPPKFIRTEYDRDYSHRSWSQGDRRGVWFDYNNDGLVDFSVDNSGFPPHSRLILFRQESDHAFTNMSVELGVDILNPSGTITIDLNRDGNMDIVTGQTNIRNAGIPRQLYLFENISPFKGNKAIRIHLEGRKSNSQGIGAMVMLETKNFSLRKWVEYASGSLPSQNESGIHFGLGKNNQLKYAEVRWPYGIKDKAGRVKPLLKRYSLKSLKFKKFTEITLCENGQMKLGRTTCP